MSYLNIDAGKVAGQLLSSFTQGAIHEGINQASNLGKRSAGAFFSSASQSLSQMSNFGSSQSQHDDYSQAEKTARLVNGTQTGISTGSVVGSMMRPGYGGELSFVHNNVNAPIKHKTGEHPGPSSPKDPFQCELQLYRGLSLNMDFAFRLYLPSSDYGTQYPVTRTYVNHMFRHYNYATYSATSTYGPGTLAWQDTLGPDNALVRQAIPAGPVIAAQAAVFTAAGLNNTLNSPVRTPVSGQFMYPRMTQQLVENMGWAAHPDKTYSMLPGTGSVIASTNKLVYANAASGSSASQPVSLPAQQPVVPGTLGNSPYYYRCQQSKGKITYNFGNDSSVPAVVDIVITKIKKGQTWDVATAPDLFTDVVKSGYSRKSTAISSLAGLAGASPQSNQCLVDSKVPFIPSYVFKYAENQDGTSSTSFFANQPFRFVSRDQFIISAGATRSWSFDLPALDYDPRRMGVTNSSLNGLPHYGNENSYIVSIAISTPNVPLIERGQVTGVVNDNYSVVDRRSADVAVSCTGSYHEYVHPVYLSSDTVVTPQIFGSLDQPHYTTAPTLPGTLQFANLANSSQATRSSAETSAILAVGAVSSLGL